MPIEYASPFKRHYFLFERSATFLGVCQKYGFKAMDFDIADNETLAPHRKIDLFKEIIYARANLPSVFDEFTRDDLIFAFFPCTYFSARALHVTRCHAYGSSDWDELQRLTYNLDRMDSTLNFYRHLVDLVYVCCERGFNLVIENPWSKPYSFLKAFFPFDPAYIDYDRHAHGDYFEKPTAYWFFGFQRRENIVLDGIDLKPLRKIEDLRGFERSRISPDYAEWFMKSFIWEQVEVGYEEKVV